jgi:hypothetical protein
VVRSALGPAKADTVAAMAPGEWFRGAGSTGVAEFLASHQHCDAGFDVKRDRGPGSGGLKITCTGCGQSVEYLAAEAAEMASDSPIENGEIPLDRAESPPAPRPSPVSEDTRSQPAQPDHPPRPRGLAGLLPNVLFVAGEEIAVVISAGGYSFLLTLRKHRGADERTSEAEDPSSPDSGPATGSARRSRRSWRRCRLW